MSNELSKDEKELLKGVAMPGDADEPMDKAKAERKTRAAKKTDEHSEHGEHAPDPAAHDPHEHDTRDTNAHNSPEAKQAEQDAQADMARGDGTPVQYDDDGFGGLPVQMRDQS